MPRSNPMDEDLAEFVAHARERGMDLPSVQGLLASAGWSEEEVAAVWCARVLDRPIPPAPRVRTGSRARVPISPRDAFWHLLGYGALYAWVISLIVLLFQYVNLALPDAAWTENRYAEHYAHQGVRWALAVLLVAYPLFLVVWRLLLRDLRAHPEKARSLVRRWLTWFSLLTGAVTLLTDLITLLYFLLEGEVTLRFVLKVVALFLVTGWVFIYLALTLRSAEPPAVEQPA